MFLRFAADDRLTEIRVRYQEGPARPDEHRPSLLAAQEVRRRTAIAAGAVGRLVGGPAGRGAEAGPVPLGGRPDLIDVSARRRRRRGDPARLAGRR